MSHEMNGYSAEGMRALRNTITEEQARRVQLLEQNKVATRSMLEGFQQELHDEGEQRRTELQAQGQELHDGTARRKGEVQDFLDQCRTERRERCADLTAMADELKHARAAWQAPPTDGGGAATASPTKAPRPAGPKGNGTSHAAGR